MSVTLSQTTPIIGVLIHITFATSTVTPSYCHLDPACRCDIMDSLHNDSRGNDDVTPGITCTVESFSLPDLTVAKLTAEITSLKIVCSDPDRENYLTSGVFNQTPVLRQLSVENCTFVVVTKDAFQTIPHLKSLDIKSCQFRILPNEIFDKTPRLSRLTLTDCGLHSLPRLCSVLELTELNVTGQPLTSLDGCVAECGSDVIFHNLTSIDISNNSLTEIPLNLIKRAPSLTELYIRDNQIKKLTVANMSALEILDVLGQELADVDFMVSEISPHIRVLKLEGNGLVQFPYPSLERLANLSHVHLERFDVTDDVWATVPFLTSLSRLALPSNRVSFLNLTFNSLNLTHLNLSRNALMQLDSTTFASQRSLVEIDLSWNNITKLTSEVFANMTSLGFLSLAHNQLNFILQVAFKNLHSLQRLFLSHNHLGSLPVFLLKEMPALKYLIVDNNNILQLPYLTRAPVLVEVTASFNRIRYLARTMFSGLRNLEFIALRGNKLTEVDSDVFLSAPSLLYLDLGENQIRKVKPFQRHPKLNLILLDSNLIRDVSFVFADLPDLMGVFLDNNTLSRLTSNMFPPVLQYLSAPLNLLTYVEPAMFVGMSLLRHVNIGFNYNLQKLPLPMVQVSPQVVPKPTFIVGPNQFTCDCEMGYLKVWYDSPHQQGVLQANLPVFKYLHGVRCVTYLSNGPVFLKDVPLSDFVCPFRQPFCDEACTCCTPYHTDMADLDANCTCVLACPDECTCFHGGSLYAKTYTHVLCNRNNLTEIPDFLSSRPTHLRLDGNNLTVLKNTTKLRQVTDVMFIHLNNSEVTIIEDDCFQGLDLLELLDLSNNKIGNIGELTFGKLGSLKELNLQHNSIQYVSPEAFTGLASLERLYLNDNQLREIDTAALTALSLTTALTLTHNPWTCSCYFAERFLEFLSSWGQRSRVIDYPTIRCFWYHSQITTDSGQSTEDRLNDCGATVTKNTSKRGETKERVEVSLTEGGSDQSGSGSSSNVTEKPSEPEGDGEGEEWCGPNFPSILISGYNPGVLCRDPKGILLPVDSNHASSMSATALAIVCVAVVAVVSVVTGVLAVRRRRELQAFLYVTLGLRLWDKAGQLDREEEELEAGDNSAIRAAAAAPYAHHRPRTYDAFVSYSHQDQDFVANVLLPRLEQRGPRRYKLCVHFRDFPVGEAIADSIIDSVESSKRVLLLLSNHFLHSEWCRFEFRAAHQYVLREGGHRLIIILLEDVDQDSLDPDLKMAMKTRTYLCVKDPWFWEKLLFAMPDVPRNQHQHDTNQQEPHHRQGPEEAPEELERGYDGGSLADARIERNDSDVRVNRVLETLEKDIERDECSVSEIMSLDLGRSQCGDRRLSATEHAGTFYDELDPGGVGSEDNSESWDKHSSGATWGDCDGSSAAGHCGADLDDVIDEDDVVCDVVLEAEGELTCSSHNALRAMEDIGRESARHLETQADDVDNDAVDTIIKDDSELARCSRSGLRGEVSESGRTSARHLGTHADDARGIVAGDTVLDCSSDREFRVTVEDTIEMPTRDLGADSDGIKGVVDVIDSNESDSDSSHPSEVRTVSIDGGGKSVVHQENNDNIASVVIQEITSENK